MIASPISDLNPILMSMGAEVTIASKSGRIVVFQRGSSMHLYTHDSFYLVLRWLSDCNDR